MDKNNRFAKKTFINVASVMVLLSTICLSLRLVCDGERPYVANVGEKEERHGARAWLVNQPTQVLPEVTPKPITPFSSENKAVTHLPDFTYAAKVATPAVVHIKTRQRAKVKNMLNPLDQLFKEFFGEGFGMNPREYEQPECYGTGSGVIYTSNGYVVTNNHVVEGADRIEVILHDNRCYVAKLIGGDPSTDLALLKINENNLPFLKVGNSDTLEVGEWVLAVGNPFNLHSTVTKGIVSAKSRQLDYKLHGEDPKTTVQSFIQTDAAINKGNSGGALVNLYGELVGINTAIYATTMAAAFVGYGFAIPVSLVKKVVRDLMQYGAVQKVLLGVTISDVHAELAKKLNLTRVCGVYIASVEETSPLAKLLHKEDVIIQINDRKINKAAELQEVVACANPGDTITITLYRKGKVKTVTVILEKVADPVKVVQRNNYLQIEAEGATFQNLDEKTKAKLKLTTGVLVTEVAKGKFQAAGLKKGYILLAFDKRPIPNVKALYEMLRHTKGEGAALLEVIEPTKGAVIYLAIDFGSQSSNR